MSRGSKPGEHRGGRKPGSVNHVTRDLRARAGKFTDKALKTLVAIMDDETAPAAARATASIAVLDRGHGRPAQSVEVGGANGQPIRTHVTVEFVEPKKPGAGR